MDDDGSRRIVGATCAPWIVSSLVLTVCALVSGSICAQPATASPAPARPSAAASSSVAPDPLERCVSAHERAREARDAGRLLESRPILGECSDEGCPIALRSECAEWLAEAARQAPTVVLSAGSASGDEEQARVFMDGRLLADKLDGAAIEVPPGPHHFRFELKGHAPLEVRAVVGLGEKNRAIRVTVPEPAPEPPRVRTQPKVPPTVGRRGRRVRAESIVLGSLAAAGAAVASGFLAKGIIERERAMESCSPLCSSSRKSRVQRWFILADVAGASAALAGGAAVYLYFASDPVPVEHGLSLGIGGSF